MKVTADSLPSFSPPAMRWCWRRCVTGRARTAQRWLHGSGAEHPDAKVEALRAALRGRSVAAACWPGSSNCSMSTRTVSVVPVRVFWVPGGLPTRSKVVALLTGRDPTARRSFCSAASCARIRTRQGGGRRTGDGLGAAAQWSETTVAENPRDFARFVMRRAELAIDRVELRLLGPEYKSPRLIKPEMLASTRFREGLEKIPGATVDSAGDMLDELATGGAGSPSI